MKLFYALSFAIFIAYFLHTSVFFVSRLSLGRQLMADDEGDGMDGS